MAKQQSIDPNTVPQGKAPSVTDSVLADQPAKEFKFQVNSVDQVKIKVKQGNKPVAKAHQDTAATGNGFTRDRVVINLGMVEEADGTTPATTFSPPFELRLRYYAADLSAAGGRTNLKVAYFANGSWTVVSATAEADYPSDPNSAGYLLVSRDTWPADPPVAIGH